MMKSGIDAAKAAGALVAGAVLLVGGSALADDAAFGTKGQLSIQGDAQVSFMAMSASKDDVTMSNSSLTVAPAVDYFISDKLSIGGTVGYQKNWMSMDMAGTETETSSSNFFVGPRVGYNVGLTDTLSLWPRLGVNYAMGGSDEDGADKRTSLAVAIDAPVLVHLAPHFFVGLAPAFSMELMAKVGDADDAKMVSYGLKSLVGGYF